jgi:SEC-C motif-containing protein
MIDCPCCSGKTYAVCCEPIINNESANTALVLMRSRYSAYQTGQAEYLFNTTHPRTRAQYKVSEIESWANENTWTKLEIISAEHGKINDSRGIVEFKAFFKDKNEKAQIHHERSTFVKENDKWYYFEGKINPKAINLMKKVSRNDPCPCGSGKKYKRCCEKN